MRISDWSSDVCSSDLSFAIRISLPVIVAIPQAGMGRFPPQVQISSRDGAARCGDPGRSWRQFRAQRGGEAVGPFFHRGRIGKAVVADLDQCRRNMAIVTVDEDRIIFLPADRIDRKSTRLNSRPECAYRLPASDRKNK